MVKSGGAYRGIAYAQLYLDVERFALGLKAIGVTKGDRVALISENRPEWIVADMGLMHLGAVSVPLYPTMTAKQIEYVFDDADISFAIVSNQMQLAKLRKFMGRSGGVKAVIVMNETGEAEEEREVSFPSVADRGAKEHSLHENFLRAASQAVSPGDLLTVIYTSGTTGNPRGVMITHKNMASNIAASSTRLSIVEGDILLSFLPLSHSFERMAGYYTAMSCGATIAFAEGIDSLRENMLEVRPTVMTCVPRLFERMYHRILRQVDAEPSWRRKIFHWGIQTGKAFAKARKGETFSPHLFVFRAIADALVFRKVRERTGGRIRFFVSGGAPLAPELGEFFEAVGLPIIEGYGLSESSPVISVNALEDYRFGTVGRPIPGVEVVIASDGEILARGPNITQGYLNDPDASREVIDAGGWLHTGDIGMIDEDGYLRITDRKKHLIVTSGGKNIAPQPIENLFLQSKYIEQFVLIGDGRMYCTALIVPEFDALKSLGLEEDAIDGNDELTIVAPEVVAFFDGEISAIQKELPNYERVRKFTLLRNPFSVEGGELTPTLKTKRKVVSEKYEEIIEKMYEPGVRSSGGGRE